MGKQIFQIDFDFAEFMEAIQTGFDRDIKLQTPASLQDIESSQMMRTRNLESKDLVKMPYNAFEQLYGM